MQRQARTAAPLSYSFSDRTKELSDIRERKVQTQKNIARVGDLFFLVPGAAPSFFSYKKEKKDGGAHYAGHRL